MSTSNEDRLNGEGNVLKGKVKKIAGEITDDEKLKGEGTLDKLKGAAQKVEADVKDTIKKGLDKV